ncbi:MAG: glutamate racemase [Gammaproteobacteria bacterium]
MNTSVLRSVPARATDAPIGVFDSGVGGLSVWRELAIALPGEDLIYVADQAHVPYGVRPPDEIARFAHGLTRYLVDAGCKAIVVACNTASAAALKSLREAHPGLDIIGMEPAVKPAAASTRRGVIGVLATPATFAGRLFQETARRHAQGVRIVAEACEGLAARIEHGHLDDPDTLAALRAHLAPILAAEADVLVLACTHYPFLREAIAAIVGPGCTVIDPAAAIARHLRHRLQAHALLNPCTGPGQRRFVTTGDPVAFAAALTRLVGVTAWPGQAHWQQDTIVDHAVTRIGGDANCVA